MQQSKSDFHLTPILVWTIVQLAALTIAACRARLWARMPMPTENYALSIMIVAQLFTSALLFPWLMRDARSAVFVVLIALPFIQLAGILGGNNGHEIFSQIAQRSAWLLSLLLWNSFLRSSTHQLVATATASSLVIGGCCLIYLRMEFATNAVISLQNLLWMFPAASVVTGLAIAWWTGRKKLSTIH